MHVTAGYAKKPNTPRPGKYDKFLRESLHTMRTRNLECLEISMDEGENAKTICNSLNRAIKRLGLNLYACYKGDVVRLIRV